MANTVSDLLARGVRVWWSCAECQASGDADLPAIIAAKGPGFDLTDRAPPCRTPGCTYWVNFYANDGQRNWPLRTEAGVMRQMGRRSDWLTKKWRSEGKTIHGAVGGRSTGSLP